jgi:hypothetical protein
MLKRLLKGLGFGPKPHGFIAAVQDGNLEKVEAFIAEGVDVDVKDWADPTAHCWSGSTALVWAEVIDSNLIKHWIHPMSATAKPRTPTWPTILPAEFLPVVDGTCSLGLQRVHAFDRLRHLTATLFTVLSSCAPADFEPWAYLRNVFDNIAND